MAMHEMCLLHRCTMHRTCVRSDFNYSVNAHQEYLKVTPKNYGMNTCEAYFPINMDNAPSHLLPNLYFVENGEL